MLLKVFPPPNLKSLPFGLIVFIGMFCFRDGITTSQQHVLFLLFDELLFWSYVVVCNPKMMGVTCTKSYKN